MKEDGTFTYTTEPKVAGTYTATVYAVKGDKVSEAKTATVTIDPSVVGKLELATDRIADAAGQKLALVAKDQYDAEVALTSADVTVLAYNVTTGQNLGEVADFANVDLSANIALNDKVRLTIFLKDNPSVKVVKEVTVADLTVNAVALGDVTLPDGVARATVGTANVNVGYTAADAFGTATKLAVDADLTDNSGVSVEGLVWRFANISAAAVNAQGELVVTLGNDVTKPATITVTNPKTGDVSTKSIALYAQADTSSISLTAPTGKIRVGAGAQKVGFEVKDQYGVVINPAVDAHWATSDVQLASSNDNVATVAWNGNDIEVTPVADGDVTITATVVTGVANPVTKVATLNLKIDKALAPSVIEVSGTPTTTLAQGQTVNDLKFAAKDQEGNVVSLSGNYKIELQVTDADDVLDDTKPTTASDLTTTDNPVEVKANAKNGTATVKAVLFNDANTDGVVDAAEEVANTTVTYSVVAPVITSATLVGSNNLTFTGSDVNGFDYVAAAGTPGTDFVFTLKDQASNTVAIDADSNVNFTVTNNGTKDVVVTNVVGAPVTVAAGTSKVLTNVIAKNDNNTKITVAAANATDVTVTAQLAGNAGTAKSTDIVFVPAANIMLADGTSARTLSGTVAGVNTGADATDGTDLVIKTSLGYFVVPSAVKFENITVDGNTSLDEAALESVIKYGDSIVVTLDNQAEGSDSDSITLTRK